MCGARIAIVVRDDGGRAQTGALVQVRGRPKITPRGIEFSDARVIVVQGPSVLERLRAATGRVLDTLYAKRAPLARALVIADDRDVDPQIRDQFADAGIVHMLSVSGLHVAILGEGVALLFGMARLSRRRVQVATILTVVFYVAVIGAPSPAVRSAAMLAASRIAQLRQRPTSDWAALALGALLPLVDPREVAALGYQLSVAGMAALLASARLLRRIGTRGGGRLAVLGRECATTIIATAVSAPVVAATFGRLSLVAPVTNLVVAPLFGLLQPALFISLLLSPVRVVAHVVADGASLLMDFVTAIATLAAKVPGSVVLVVPSLSVTLALSIAAAALVLACAARYWARPALVALGAACAAAWLPMLPGTRGALELHVIDVGQGDAIALRTPGGRWIVVDAGPAWERGDAGELTVAPYLERRGGDVALFALSHPHADHVGGAAAVMSHVRTEVMWDAARVFGGDRYAAALESARAHAVEWVRVRPGLTREIDGVALEVLAPDSAWTADRDDPNTSSVVIRVSYGQVHMLLTGDAEQEEEGWLLEHYPDALFADVLKVAHHGSSTSSTDAFLDAVHPRLALISVGTKNRYGHPSPDVLRRFDDRHVEVLRTDRDGGIVVRTDGTRIWVSAREERWLLPP
jgi:competence protein ComEC